MSYSNFTFDQLRNELNLVTRDQASLFNHIAEATVSTQFAEALKRDNIPLGLAINTEKARSELIISPLLLELRRLMDRKIGLFSGIEFNVDEEQGLKGVCDFIVSLSDEQFFLDAPVVVIVEAKKENIVKGIPQCIAEMRAAQMFNEKRGNVIHTVYGIVTTGSNWKFLKLQGRTASIDFDEYHIKELDKILGILHSMCQLNA